MVDEQLARQWLDTMPAYFREIVLTTNRLTGRDVRMHYRTYHSTLHVMFRSVPAELRPGAAMVSSLGVVICSHADYWADTARRLDLVEEAAAHVLRGAPIRSPELAILPEVWRRYMEIVREGPMFERVHGRLMTELDRLFESMRYSVLVNTDDTVVHRYATAMEKMAPNMLGVQKHLIDIAFSPGWRQEWTEAALAVAGKMIVVVRIGNCTKSWRQEIELQRDISSVVCAVALEHGVVDWKALKLDDPRRAIEKIETTRIDVLGGLTALEFLHEEMLRHISDIERMGEMEFLDMPSYLSSLRLVVDYQMRGSTEAR